MINRYIVTILMGVLLTVGYCCIQAQQYVDIHALEKQAKESVEAQVELGMRFLKGDGVVRDVKKSEKWLKKAAEKGNAKAQYLLGTLYLSNMKNEKQKRKALELIELSAKQGFAEAELYLGNWYYADGKNIKEREIQTGLNWFLKASNHGNREATVKLLNILSQEEYAEQNKEIIEILKLRAALHGVKEYVAWGADYYFTKGNTIKGVELVKTGVSLEDPWCLYKLGLFSLTGKYVEQNYDNAFNYFNIANQKGFKEAYSLLGICYLYGAGTPANASKAISCFQKDKGNIIADFYLAVCSRLEIGGLQNDVIGINKTVKKLNESKDSENLKILNEITLEFGKNGNEIAEYSMGFIFYNGIGQDESEKEAFQWIMKAAEYGLPAALNDMGRYYESGSENSNDINEAVKYYKLAADKGDIHGLFNLGSCYEMGKGVKQDNREAFKYYQIMASKDNAVGQYLVGVCFINGIGVEKDLEVGVNYISKAAEKEFHIAQDLLGRAYQEGIIINQDFKEAIRYFRLAADQDLPEAIYHLGVCYERGVGTGKDIKEAIKYYKTAAEKGCPDAQYELALRYDEGIGVEQNKQEAIRNYRLAADQDHGGAQLRLGVYYEEGNYVPQSDSEAIKWYKKAQANGLDIPKEPSVIIDNAYTEGNVVQDLGKGMQVKYSFNTYWMKQMEIKIVTSLYFSNGKPLNYIRGNAISATQYITPSYIFRQYYDCYVHFPYEMMALNYGNNDCYAVIRFYNASTGKLLGSSEKLRFDVIRY